MKSLGRLGRLTSALNRPIDGRRFSTAPDLNDPKSKLTGAEGTVKSDKTVINQDNAILRSLKEGIESKISVWTLNAFNSILDYKITNKADIGWLQKTHSIPPINITQKFDQTIDKIQKEDPNVMNLAASPVADNTFCFVGGLWSNWAPLWFRTAMVRFKEAGLTSDQAVIDTSAGIKHNAAVLREAIPKLAEKHQKKVVLIGHSKGGVDSLSTLLMYPDVQNHVAGLITVQSPIGGSVLADDFMFSSSVGKSLLDLLFVRHVSGADYRCIIDLTIAERKKLLEEFPLHNLLRVPMLNFASHITSTHNNRYYRGLYDYSLTNYGIEGDGFVSVQDAVVPAYPYVNTSGISHIGTGSMLGVQFGQERLAAADIQHALVILMSQIIEASKSEETNSTAG